MAIRNSLFARILFWFFVNLAALAVVLLVFFNLQFRFAPDSPIFTAFGHRLDFVAGLIGEEIRAADPTERDAILQRYSAGYGVEFLLYSARGERIAGPERMLPAEVRGLLAGMPPLHGGRRPMAPRAGGRGGPPPGPQPVFTIRTTEPTRYWAGVRLPVPGEADSRPMPAVLVVSSDSISGHGLFFDIKPWLLVVAVVFALSVALWFPFVRGLTRAIRQMTAATERIADEQFDTRVTVHRSDELGRLGGAINQLATRLESFVAGQKRFLGGVSHELNSPLARLQFALSILDERVGEGERAYVADAREDVRAMSDLVAELLAFAKAGMKTAEVRLERVLVRPVAQAVAAREAAGREVTIEVDEAIAVRAQPELLSRALANVVRNAARYAGDAGPIVVSATSGAARVIIRVADHGPGVPAESVGRLFEPFYRTEPDRARRTGGSGLGLAIAKTCVEACGGIVSARNLAPAGFEVTIEFDAA